MYNYKEEKNTYDDTIELNVASFFEGLLAEAERHIINMIMILVLSCTVVVGGASVFFKPVHTGYITYLAEKTGDSTSDAAVVTALGIALPDIYKTTGLEKMLKEELGEDSAWLKSSMFSCMVDGTTNMLLLKVSDENYDHADRLYSALKKVFPNYACLVEGSISLSIINETEPVAETLAGYSFVLMAALGVLIGIVVNALLLVLRTLFRNSVRRKEDMYSITSLNHIGSIPLVKLTERKAKKRIINIQNANSKMNPFIQSIRGITYRIEKDIQKYGDKVLMITSTVAGEGKSTIAVNLALAFADRGNRVLIIDQDFRNPSVAFELGIDGSIEYDLKDYLFGDEEIDKIIINHRGIDIIPVKKTSKIDPLYLGSNKMEDLLIAAREVYDVIILDTSPVLITSDANIIAKTADAMLYVVQYDETKKTYIERGLSVFSVMDIHQLGYVINGVDHKLKSYDKYGYGKYNNTYNYGKKA